LNLLNPLNRPAVFLDRDGTIIEDVGYLDSLDRIAWYPWSVDAIRALNQAGFPVVVVTNQAGVARGYFAEAFVRETHRALDAVLAAGGARVDAYYYCPHHADGSVAAYAQTCDCRKPGCGMITRAAVDLGLDPTRSVVVGDAWTDIGAARAAGARGLLLRADGRRLKDKLGADCEPDAIVDHLAAAASWILTNVDRT
jgi:D-glycero-D-manno-heptose 1,7-bisphosphate phosphatase